MSEIKEKNEPLNKNNKVPKLRFPYFFTEWTKSSFGDAVSLSKEKYNPSKCNDKKIDIEMDSIESNTGRLLIKYSSSDYNSIKNIFSSNSILYGKLRPYLRKFYKATFEGVCSSEFWVFNPSQTTQDFLYYFISTDYFNINANKTCGTKMPRAEWNKVKELHFYYPSREEQIKIANFLEYIDKKIILTNNKLDILKKYKKGLCNNLFIDDSISNIHLYDLVNNKPSQLLTKDIEKNVGTYPVYDATGKVLKNIDYYQQESDSVSIIKYGSGCGRTFISKGKHSILGTMTDLIPFDKGNTYFIYAYTNSNSFRRIVKKYTEIGTTPNLYYSDYSTATISLKALTNKDQISKLILSIEEKEDLLNQQLNQLNILKKNLLNLLFI